MYKLALLALAGSLGTLARYGLSGAVYALLGRDFPWGTSAVNVLGCLLFGMVWTLADERMLISGEARTIILVGFMGAFTTFSSLIFETDQLLRASQWLYAALNLCGETVIGFAALWLGMVLARLL